MQPLDLSIEQGEFVSIVGHSGSGKSTLLSLIGGIARPDTGTVLIDGINIRDYDDGRLSKLRNEKFGFVYQFASLIPTLTATENVLLPTVFGGNKKAADAVRLLADGRLGRQDRPVSLGAYPAANSSAWPSRAPSSHGPEIILADEPTGDLDEETEAEIMAFFEKDQSGDRKSP